MASFGDYLRFLIPLRLFGLFWRSVVYEKIGHCAQAALACNRVVTELEGKWEIDKLSNRQLQCLLALFNRLLRQQLLAGRVDDATVTIIRANSLLGVAYLPDFQCFDVKVAHIVKAGIAAGKLLEEGGLATLMVRQGQEPIVEGDDDTPRKTKRNSFLSESKEGAKIIPFPSTT